MPENPTVDNPLKPGLGYSAYFPFLANDFTINGHVLHGSYSTSTEFDAELFTQVLARSQDTFGGKAIAHHVASGQGKAERIDFAVHIKPARLKQPGVLHYVSAAIGQMAQGQRHFALDNLAAAQRQAFADAVRALGPARAIALIQDDLSTREPDVRQMGLAHLWLGTYQHVATSLEDDSALTELTNELASGDLARAKQLADALVREPFGFDHLSGKSRSGNVFTDIYQPRLSQWRTRSREEFVGTARPNPRAENILEPAADQTPVRPLRNSRTKEQHIGVVLYYISEDFQGHLTGAAIPVKLPVGGAIDTTRAAIAAQIADRRKLVLEHDAAIWKVRDAHPDVEASRPDKSPLFHHLRAGLAITALGGRTGKIQSVRAQLNELDQRRKAGLTDLIAVLPPLEVGRIVADAFDQAITLSTRPKFTANGHAADVLRAAQKLLPSFKIALSSNDHQTATAHRDMMLRLTEQLAYTETLQRRQPPTAQAIADACGTLDTSAPGKNELAQFDAEVAQPLSDYRLNQRTYADIGEELRFSDMGTLKWRAGGGVPRPAGDFTRHYRYAGGRAQPSNNPVIVFPLRRPFHKYALTLSSAQSTHALRTAIGRIITPPHPTLASGYGEWAQALLRGPDLGSAIDDLLRERDRSLEQGRDPMHLMRDFISELSHQHDYFGWHEQLAATHGTGALLNAPHLADLIANVITHFGDTDTNSVVDNTAFLEHGLRLLETMLSQTDAEPQELEKVTELYHTVVEALETYVEDQSGEKLRDSVIGLDVSTLRSLQRPDTSTVMERIFGDATETYLGASGHGAGEEVTVHITAVDTELHSPINHPEPVKIQLGGDVSQFYAPKTLQKTLSGPLIISTPEYPTEVNLRNPHGPAIGERTTAQDAYVELAHLPPGHDYAALELLIAAKVAAHSDAIKEKGALIVLRNQISQLLLSLKDNETHEARLPNAATADANLPELAKTLNALAEEMASATPEHQAEAAIWGAHGHTLLGSLISIVVRETPQGAGTRFSSDPNAFAAQEQIAQKASEILKLAAPMTAQQAWATVLETPYTAATSPLQSLAQRHHERLRSQRLGGSPTVTIGREPIGQLPPGRAALGRSDRPQQ